jgi:hypothetical protein
MAPRKHKMADKRTTWVSQKAEEEGKAATAVLNSNG